MSEPFSLNEKIYQRLLLLQAHDEFMDDILTLRKKVKDTSYAEEDEYGDISILQNEDAPDFDIEIKKIRDKYNLSNVYDFSLRYYIGNNTLIPFHKIQYTGNLMPRLIPEIEDPSFYTSEETGNDEIHYPSNWDDEQFVAIEIFPETSIKDIVANWDKISKKRDSLYGINNKKTERLMRSDNLERDLEVLKLKKQSKTGKQIALTINSDDRFSNGKPIGYEDVPKIISRLKLRILKVIPNKDS